MKIVKRSILAATALFTVVMAGTGCTKTYSTASDTTTPVTQTSQSLIDYLNNNYSFSIYLTAIKRTGLDKQLVNDKPFTLLIPDNDAFARAGISIDSIRAMDTAVLRQWMACHILQGAVKYSDIPQTVDNMYYTIEGGRVLLSKPITPSATRVLHVNGEMVNNFDLQAYNGFIHVLNKPLPVPVNGNLQDYINANLNTFSLFKQGLIKFNLWDSLKNTSGAMTVFAPVNAAFSQRRYPDGTYHTINTDSITGWNTAIIPQAVFGAYIMNSRFLTTDFSDLPGSNTEPLYYLLPNQTGYLSFSYAFRTLGAGLINSTYRVKYNGAPAPQSPGNIITKNGNCVLQAVNDLLMIP